MVKSAWYRFIRTGITESLDPREGRKVSYNNFVAFMWLIYINTRVLFSLKDPPYAFILFCTNIAPVTVLTLNYFHLYNAAKHILIYSILVGACYFAHFHLGGFNQGVHMIIITTMVFSFIFFGTITQKKAAMIKPGTPLG